MVPALRVEASVPDVHFQMADLSVVQLAPEVWDVAKQRFLLFPGHCCHQGA